MNCMTSHNVVERLAADLAERRRLTIHRNAAYLALARAILNDDASERPTHLVQDWDTAVAA